EADRCGKGPEGDADIHTHGRRDSRSTTVEKRVSRHEGGVDAGRDDDDHRDREKRQHVHTRIMAARAQPAAPSATLTATITAPPSVMCATERRKLVSRNR